MLTLPLLAGVGLERSAVDVVPLAGAVVNHELDAVLGARAALRPLPQAVAPQRRRTVHVEVLRVVGLWSMEECAMDSVQIYIGKCEAFGIFSTSVKLTDLIYLKNRLQKVEINYTKT